MGDDEHPMAAAYKEIQAMLSVLIGAPLPHPADPIGDACCRAIERIATPPSTPKE
jgi:hypothetical protein